VVDVVIEGNEEKIKKLAQKSLKNKWRGLIVQDELVWGKKCDFCREVINRTDNAIMFCDDCLISDLPLCDFICECAHTRESKKLVIKALEELAELGDLLDLTYVKLKRGVK